MKHFFPLLAVIGMPFLGVWLGAGFVVWNWNPAHWSEVLRFNAALSGLGFAIVCSWIYLGYNTPN